VGDDEGNSLWSHSSALNSALFPLKRLLNGVLTSASLVLLSLTNPNLPLTS
jgi:hypothetical protein